MPVKPVGSQWLKEHYNLAGYPLTHCSYIGNNGSIEVTSKGNIEQVYGPKYVPVADTPLEHIQFSLKYDDLNLDFLKTVFEKIQVSEIIALIDASPSGKYARKIGFLYEFLSGKQLKLKKTITGNYADLLDADKYITGQVIKNARWRINDNLLGIATFCPIVRRTRSLILLLQQDIPGKIEQLRRAYPQDIFSRATRYLYKKETRSSYEIEKEKPSPDRMEKFIALLVKAGTEPVEQMLGEERLVQLQNAIVDSRFAAAGFRDFQNYIGESLPDHSELMHYICPPPEFVSTLMEGLKETALRMKGTPAEIRAAVIAFGFVFTHPFEDGNGRLHRFLIHDVLVNDGVVQEGLIIPVSAHMLSNIKDYDDILEHYSKPLMQRIRYNKKENAEIELINPKEVEGYFRYPDFTAQCVYLAETIHATIASDMPAELEFIQRYDEVKKELQNIVDMPDKDINLMIIFLHQNKGIFPRRRRYDFSKLTDKEIAMMQLAYRRIFELGELGG